MFSTGGFSFEMITNSQVQINREPLDRWGE
jgi:hypothetical protein